MKSGKGLIDKEKHGFRISVPIGLSDRLVALVFVILTVFYYLNQFIDHSKLRDKPASCNCIDAMNSSVFRILSIMGDGYGTIHLVRRQNFRKTYISYTLIRPYTCAYQGVRNSFLENFAYLLNE